MKPKTPKKRNPADETPRNRIATRKLIDELERKYEMLDREIKFLKSIVIPFAFEKYVKLVKQKGRRS